MQKFKIQKHKAQSSKSEKSLVKGSKLTVETQRGFKHSINKLGRGLSIPRGFLKDIDLKDGFRSLFYMLKNIFNLTIFELKNYFSSSLAYVIVALFIIVISILVFAVFNYNDIGRADLTPLFTSIAFAFVFIIPSLTMGSISKEKQNGTLEFLLTEPITVFEFIVAKFVSSASLSLVMILSTLPFSLSIASWGEVDLGQLTMQYIGSFLLALCFITIGIAASSLYKSEISSLLTSIFVSSILVVSGTGLADLFPLSFDSFLDKISLITHFQSMSRGVLDIRDLLYFLAFIFAFLSIAYFVVLQGNIPKTNIKYYKAQAFVAISLVAAFGIGYAGLLIPGRIDFTEDKVYTLSDSTKEIVNDIDGKLEITLYTSSNLPIQFQSDLRNVEDILRDYQIVSKGKIDIKTKYTNDDSAIEEEAKNLGLEELVFAIDTEDSAARTVGYFGLGFRYKDIEEGLSLSQDSDSIEFDITKKIRKLTNKDKKEIAFLNNNSLRSLSYDLTKLDSELSSLYEVSTVNLDSENPNIPEGIDVLILAGPSGDIGEEARSNILKFFEDGGSVLLLTNPIFFSDQSFTPVQNSNSLGEIFKDYGVSVNEDLVYDLESNNPIDMGKGLYVIPVDYPLWINAKSSNQDIEILNQINSVSLLWASSLSINKDNEKNADVTPLLITTKNSNVQKIPDIKVDPNTEFKSQADDNVRVISASIENQKQGRAVIVGDSLFISDNSIDANQNLAFSLSSIEWLAKDSGISEIKAKTRIAPLLNLSKQQSSTLVSVGLVTPLLIVAITGIGFNYLRRQNTKKVYGDE